MQAPPPAELCACPGRKASSAVPAPDAFEKAATPSSKRRLCSSALLHAMRFTWHHATSLHHESICNIPATQPHLSQLHNDGRWSHVLVSRMAGLCILPCNTVD